MSHKKSERNGRNTKKGKRRRTKQFYGINTPRGARFIMNQFIKKTTKDKTKKKTKKNINNKSRK